MFHILQDASFPTSNLHTMYVLHVYPYILILRFKRELYLKIILSGFLFNFYNKKLFHILCYCMESKVLLILVNLGIEIPYYPAA